MLHSAPNVLERALHAIFKHVLMTGSGSMASSANLLALIG
jgi:hypothetical protein